MPARAAARQVTGARSETAGMGIVKEGGSARGMMGAMWMRSEGFPPGTRAAPITPRASSRGKDRPEPAFPLNPARGYHVPSLPGTLRGCVPSVGKAATGGGARVVLGVGRAAMAKVPAQVSQVGGSEIGCLVGPHCFKSEGRGDPTMSDSAWAVRNHVPASELPLFPSFKMGGFSLRV